MKIDDEDAEEEKYGPHYSLFEDDEMKRLVVTAVLKECGEIEGVISCENILPQHIEVLRVIQFCILRELILNLELPQHLLCKPALSDLIPTAETKRNNITESFSHHQAAENHKTQPE